MSYSFSADFEDTGVRMECPSLPVLVQSVIKELIYNGHMPQLTYERVCKAFAAGVENVHDWDIRTGKCIVEIRRF